MKKLLPLSLILFSVVSHASVYRCEQNGVTLFSQTPCADNAEKLAQYDTTPTKRDAASPARDSAQNSNATESLQQISLNVRKQSLERQLQQLNNRRQNLERERNAKLSEITGEDIQSPDAVTGRTFIAGAAEEMRSVLNHYQLEISKVQQQAGQVAEQLRQLQAL
ncbi:DUF4124 domain-containing protein [Alkalimonas sp. MEB108]|uniref:DUF4124 domain-containing protein n=1 Tax=Alkalimonas cellulosilytica TaxID=3058395 RepID=A0ABU7J6X3_9GAMM|nr:DUF4124 domain-containing protein [Alkalimonas sp. MEB108]MEE2002275.1 DUF4124 domain-containing protein [Alkalimonas sp. MEB108]